MAESFILARRDQQYRVLYADGYTSALMNYSEATTYAKLFGGLIRKEPGAPKFWQFWKQWPHAPRDTAHG